MHFSAKITNSILAFMSRRQWPRERLFEMTELPYEFLRDPSCWLHAGEVEAFLAAVVREQMIHDPNLLNEVGLAASELRAWGVLDSVLKMMASPFDIYAQPQRFLSYFISPAPPIANLKKEVDGVAFDLPIAQSEYPHVVAYLGAALAGLPRYFGHEPAHVDWKSNSIRIRWSNGQGRLLKREEDRPVPGPELMNRLVQDVEITQARLETRDLEVARLEREVKELKGEVRRLKARTPSEPIAATERRLLSEQLALVRDLSSKLSDCMTRAHQAVGFAKVLLQNEVQFQSVLRRVDWEGIRAQYPWYHLQTVELIERMQKKLAASSVAVQEVGPMAAAEDLHNGESVAKVIHAIVEQWQQDHPRGVEIQETTFFSPERVVDSTRFSVVLNRLLAHVSEEIRHSGRIELIGRESGGQAELRLLGRRARRSGRPPKEDELPLFAGERESNPWLDDSMRALLAPLRAEVEMTKNESGEREWVCRWAFASSGGKHHDASN